jgi:hypothetical protein
MLCHDCLQFSSNYLPFFLLIAFFNFIQFLRLNIGHTYSLIYLPGSAQTEVAFTKQRDLFPVCCITWGRLALIWEAPRVLRSSVLLQLGARRFDRLLVCLEPIRHICLIVIGCRCRYERPADIQ